MSSIVPGTVPSQWGVPTQVDFLRFFGPRRGSTETEPGDFRLLRWVTTVFRKEIVPENAAVELLKEQIVEGFREVLSAMEGVQRAFVLFAKPEDAEYGVLECQFFFFVSKRLYFHIDRLYSATDGVRDFFEDEKDVCISYHFDPYTGQSVEDIVPEGAQEIYLVPREILSTASQF